MTNKEKYLDKLANIAIEHGCVAIVNGEPVDCCTTPCAACAFGNDVEVDSRNCDPRKIFDWATAEYVETQADWNQIPVDTLILVKNHVNDDWTRRYFAGIENNKVHTWTNGTTSQTTPNLRIWESWNYATLIK